MKVQEAESVDMELYEMMKVKKIIIKNLRKVNMFQDASQRLQRIKSKTRELKGAQKKSKRKVQALKTVRSQSMTIICVLVGIH